MPDALVRESRGGLLSDNPAAQVFAAQQVAALEKENPALVADIPERERVLARTISEAALPGIGPDLALKLASTRLAQGKPITDAGAPVTTGRAPEEFQSFPSRRKTTQQRIRETQRRMIEEIVRQIRPEAQRDIDKAKHNPNPEEPHIFKYEESRRWAILNNWPNVRFNIADNPDADGSEPLHAFDTLGVDAVSKYKDIIQSEAQKQGVYPD